MPAKREPRVPPGLGPESVAWRVHASPVTLLGGIRALVIQALHPLAMAGVTDHSSFHDDVWGRLGRTRAGWRTARCRSGPRLRQTATGAEGGAVSGARSRHQL